MSLVGIAQPTSQRAYYEIIARIGRGGMGDVFLARNTGERNVTRMVVLKRAITNSDLDEEYQQALLNEARLSFALCHPNIAQVYDFACIRGVYYLATEYVPGVSLLTLSRRLADLGLRLDWQHLLTIGVGICAGLFHAHNQVDEAGNSVAIIHRDIAPSNVMVSREGAVKIIDFGIAQRRVAEIPEPDDDVFKGKFAYSASERVRRGQFVDQRCDVYSLAVVLWELATGHRLFDGEAGENVSHAIRLCPPGVNRWRADVPRGFGRVIAQALEPNREKRTACVGTVLAQLEDVAADNAIALSPWRLGRYVANLPESGQRTTQAAPQPGPRRAARGSSISLPDSAASALPWLPFPTNIFPGSPVAGSDHANAADGDTRRSMFAAQQAPCRTVGLHAVDDADTAPVQRISPPS